MVRTACRAVSVCWFLVVSLIGGPAALATDFHWQGAGTGGNTAVDLTDPTTQWSEGTNWLEGGVPGGADTAYLPLENAGNVYAATAALGTLYVDGSSAEGALGIGDGVTFDSGRHTYIGYDANGQMAQTGGTHKSSELCLGYGADASGTYMLLGGELAVEGEEVGVHGAGTFVQTGGVHTVLGYLTLGFWIGSTGRYELHDGVLTTGSYGDIGFGTAGTFVQTGGMHTVNDCLILGSHRGGLGSYSLSGGELRVLGEVENIGCEEEDRGAGLFQQSGGTHQAGLRLHIGCYYSNGTYELSNGQLFARQERIGEMGAGLFRQTGGSHTADYLAVESWSEHTSRYELTGGTLQVNAGLHVEGVLDCAGGNAAITAASALVNLSKGTVLDAGATSLTLGPDSLLVVSPGFDPAAVFGEYTNAGMTHTAGETFVVGAAEGFSGWGEIGDFVETAGTITATAGGGITLLGGISMTGGTVDLGGGTLFTDDRGAYVGAGTLSAWRIRVSKTGTGTFAQVGGTCIASNGLGLGEGDYTGEYHLVGGDLVVGDEIIGYGPGDAFVQTGGTHTVEGVLNIGFYGGREGARFELAGGSLVARSVEVGRYSARGTLSLTAAEAYFEVTRRLTLSAVGTLTAVPGSVVHMTGAAGSAFKNYSTDEGALAGLENLTMVFEGGTAAWSTFEVAGRDLGAVLAGFQENFVLGSLEVGGVDAAMLRLEDLTDNANRASPEALYLHDLVIGPGSTLDLAGLNIYYDGAYVNQGTILGGAPVVVPEPGTLALLALGGLSLLGGRRRRWRRRPPWS